MACIDKVPLKYSTYETCFDILRLRYDIEIDFDWALGRT